jgi:hypothetical protein
MKKRRRITISSFRRRTTIVVRNNVESGFADPSQAGVSRSPAINQGIINARPIVKRNVDPDLFKSTKKEDSHETDS